MAKKDKDILEIEAVTINIGDTTVKVTPLQCRELYNALAQLLGEPKLTYTRPYWYYGVGNTYTTPLTSNTGNLNVANTGTLTTTNGSSMQDAGTTLTGNKITIQ